jgi:hypothetical protein
LVQEEGIEEAEQVKYFRRIGVFEMNDVNVGGEGNAWWN